MKKALLVFAIVSCLVLLTVVFRSANNPTAKNETPAVAPAKTDAIGKTSIAKTEAETNSGSLRKNAIMTALRSALAGRNEDALERAYADLLEYINGHPDQIADYVSVLREETDEHVLRRFTFALAESEVGLQNNNEIVKTVIELAKEKSFEQRQHIMLHLMSRFPEMRSDVYAAVFELSEQDPNPMVKTSAMSVMADWIDSFPDKAVDLLGQVEKIFHNEKDEEVRAFTYQLLALHSEKLPLELHQTLFERLKTEPDSYNANLITASLVGAPPEIKSQALSYVQNAFDKEPNEERRRNLLAQIVCLAREGSLALLEKTSAGDSPIAQDAKDYAALLASGGPIDAETIFMQKAIRAAKGLPGPHSDHKD